MEKYIFPSRNLPKELLLTSESTFTGESDDDRNRESVSLSSLWTPDHPPWLTQVLRREAPAWLTYPVCFSPVAFPANLEIGALIPVLHLSSIPNDSLA